MTRHVVMLCSLLGIDGLSRRWRQAMLQFADSRPKLGKEAILAFDQAKQPATRRRQGACHVPQHRLSDRTVLADDQRSGPARRFGKHELGFVGSSLCLLLLLLRCRHERGPASGEG